MLSQLRILILSYFCGLEAERTMMQFFRTSEYQSMIYRLLLAYVFYFISRFFFFVYNSDLLDVNSVYEFLQLCYYGLTFDTTAIFYLNGLFVVLSMLPLWINTRPRYQSMLFYVYFIPNLIGYAANFIDFIYYKYTFSRTTVSEWDVVKNEANKLSMLLRFLGTYWHVLALFILCASLWIYLYKKIRVTQTPYSKGYFYYGLSSVISFFVVATLMIGGIRGDFRKSTRPINLIDANRHITKMQHADLILNTPFTIIRTFNKKTFKKVSYTMDTALVDSLVNPIKQYSSGVENLPNVVVFITESMGREYMGAFNEGKNIPDYQSFTPFLDSLSSHSLIFPNAFGNGRKSIHGMSSVLAGIPSFQDAFTSSPYGNQPIESVVSILKSQGYDTSFFHGAPNGSMGFLGFSNILGFDHYYGKTEFNDDSQFDGFWGIWDEPFFGFVKNTLDQKDSPFFATIFTVSSHDPYIVPKAYEGKFPMGFNPMHQCVGYTDYAFKTFFDAAAKEPWFENTIFIITADHTNTIHYEEYLKPINRFAVPILIYSPKGTFVGKDTGLAQQIDIYPTIAELTGYEKPFRSWGRSLLDTEAKPFVLNADGPYFRYTSGNYICIFDGSKAVGFYHNSDLGLENNLIEKRNSEMDIIELECKAFIKDYYDRIIDRRLK